MVVLSRLVHCLCCRLLVCIYCMEWHCRKRQLWNVYGNQLCDEREMAREYNKFHNTMRPIIITLHVPTNSIQQIIHIFLTRRHIKAIQPPFESSHCALSIARTAKLKYRPFVNRLN